jgi:uncharacterized protein YjbJ (UPF0337 family)
MPPAHPLAEMRGAKSRKCRQKRPNLERRRRWVACGKRAAASLGCNELTGAAPQRGLKELEMDWNFAEANWQQFKCEVLANWRRLTSGHLDVIAGRRACLSKETKEAYGVTGDEAERQIKSFEARNQHPRPVSFR